MQEGYTHALVILDRSGSMQSIATDIVGGLNKFIEEQKKIPGKMTITLVQFDHEYERVWNFRDIQEAKSVNWYTPRGSTALLDAIGRAMNTTGEQLGKLDEDRRPEKVVVLVVTDGQENSSTEFTKQQIHDMIKHQEEKYTWQFVYLSADPNAFDDAHDMGFMAKNTGRYNHSRKGIVATYNVMSASLGKYRAGPRGQSLNVEESFGALSEEDKNELNVGTAGEKK